MAKTNISFNNINYSIDDSALSAASAELKSHLSTKMNGTGATINLDGTAYSVDSAKLSTATNAFVTHLGKIAGSGKKVVAGGVEYEIDSAKVEGVISELCSVFNGLSNSLTKYVFAENKRLRANGTAAAGVTTIPKEKIVEGNRLVAIFNETIYDGHLEIKPGTWSGGTTENGIWLVCDGQDIVMVGMIHPYLGAEVCSVNPIVTESTTYSCYYYA